MVVYLSELVAPSVLERLKKHVEVVDTFDRIEEIDAMLIRKQVVSRQIMEKAKNLKIISRHGVGCDMIDMEAAKELGIKVMNLPGANALSVAELAVSFMLALARKLKLADTGLQKGAFKTFAPKETIGIDTYGKTLALIGTGNIAQHVASMMSGFNMRVIAYSPHLTEEKAAQLGYERFDNIDDMLSEADYINVSVPLMDTTRNLINEKSFKKMKKTAILVNTARGGIVNENALYNALVNNQIWGAASDVFTEEPPKKDNPLLSLDNFIATPHFGSSTYECMERCGNMAVDNIFNCLGIKD